VEHASVVTAVLADADSAGLEERRMNGIGGIAVMMIVAWLLFDPLSLGISLGVVARVIDEMRAMSMDEMLAARTTMGIDQ
jgi:hypothetical protein